MIESPLTFFEVNQKAITTNTTEPGHTCFGETPEGFDAVDMVFATGELIVSMIDAMMPITTGKEAVVCGPTIGVDIGTCQDTALNNRHNFLSTNPLHNTHVDAMTSLVQPYHRNLSGGPATSLASNSPGTEVRFIDFNLTLERTQLFQSQSHDTFPQQAVDPLHRLAANGDQLSCFGRRQIQREELQNTTENRLRNVRTFYVSIIHVPSATYMMPGILKLTRP